MSDQDPRAATLLAAVNAIFDAVAVVHSPILVILDGLDRIVNEADARRVFVESGLLSRLRAHLVVTGPIVLLRTASTSAVPGFHFHVMPEIALEASPSGDVDRTPERRFFRELVARRTGDVPGRILEAHVDRLALASGDGCATS